MNPTILRSNAFGELDSAILEAFEQELNAVLPDDYRAFLLSHNGGTPQAACFLAPEDPLDGDESPLSEREVVLFFGFHPQPFGDSGSGSFTLRQAWRDLKNEQMETHLLPIAQDWSGNTICIGLVGDERGKVFFYDHEYEVATPLAEDFETFLSELKECKNQI